MDTFPTIRSYEEACEHITWEVVRRGLSNLPSSSGLNIAALAVDRHGVGAHAAVPALRAISAEGTVRDITYAQLATLTDRFANVLRSLGINKGGRVFSLAGRVPELYITALGTLKAGAVFCPLFSVFGPEPIHQRMSRGEAELLVTTSDLFEKKVRPLLDRLPTLRHVLLIDSSADLSATILSLPRLMENADESFTVEPTLPEDPALLHFTSGTTGMPKGALHVHQAVLTHYLTARLVLGLRDGDVFWCTADPGWVTGTSYGIIAPLVCGVTNIVDAAEFDAMRWYSLLAEQGVNVWYTAPTAIRRLMRLDLQPREMFDLSALRTVLSVGEPLHADAVRWGEQAFGKPILDNWWQTETGGIMIANYPFMPVKPGSMGRPLPGVEAAIATVTDTGVEIITEPNIQGHLVLRRDVPSLFRIYLGQEDRYQKCFRGEWYISGDLAKRDEDGYYWFVGRADDIIKTSGHMVGPFEVESALTQHPAVAESAVIGIPDPLIGEKVKAFVVLKDHRIDSSDLRLDILGFARKHLGPAVAPKEVAVVDALPKTRSGKILRRLLKSRELGLPEGDLSTLEQG